VADLHRSSAAQYPDLVTLRNYGFSDATEIFIFISGYTAAFVYGRAMLEAGFVVATARSCAGSGRSTSRTCSLFTIFLAEISYVATLIREPALHRRDGHHGFSQAAGCHHRPGAAAEIPPRQHGRRCPLYIVADAVPAANSCG